LMLPICFNIVGSRWHNISWVLEKPARFRTLYLSKAEKLTLGF
jgi:hypothetical protein